MRVLHFGVAVWGEDYVKTFLRLALPSFLSPANIPACSKICDVRFTVITRPQDIPLIENSSVWLGLRKFAKVKLDPFLTPDKFEGNRYAIMSWAHGFLIEECIKKGEIMSLLSPDCVISNGSLSFALNTILTGTLALLVPGPRAVLEEVEPILTRAPYVQTEGCVIAVSSSDLVSLLVHHLHPISRLLFWNSSPFSAFPSAIYWMAGQESLIARYFHLHPLFVDMASANPEAKIFLLSMLL